MNIVALTSSRADYGILSSLLLKIEAAEDFTLKIVAFGTHTSEQYGYTVSEIEADGYSDIIKVDTVNESDMPRDISESMGNTCSKLAPIWEKYASWTDLVICLGDRYEMFAAVSSTVPFNLKIAHLHGGETTLGAIDNKFRHCITTMSSLHFTATSMFKNKVAEITGSSENAYDVGALSIDKIVEIDQYDIPSFEKTFGVDLSKPTALVTLHPGTTSLDNIDATTAIFVSALNELSEKYQILITMPNSDTNGNKIRSKFLELEQENSNVICKESLGYRGYFSAMHHCKFLIGNTSSGIVEAASFEKYVINVGNRQLGRAASKNVLHTGFDHQQIIEALHIIEKNEFQYTGRNIYYKENVADRILEVLRRDNVK